MRERQVRHRFPARRHFGAALTRAVLHLPVLPLESLHPNRVPSLPNRTGLVPLPTATRGGPHANEQPRKQSHNAMALDGLQLLVRAILLATPQRTAGSQPCHLPQDEALIGPTTP